jgi:predicted  nucleic acid-binding Zn-ribbon protein
MASLLDALRGRIKQRNENAIDTIASAARAAARGERSDPAAVEKAIHDTGMTMADFEDAVEQATRRKEWLANFDKLANAVAKIGKLEATAQAEQAKFEATRAAFLERAEAIDAELRKFRQVRDAGQLARDHLLDPRSVPGSIGKRYREAVAELESMQAEVDRARNALREQTARVKSEQEWVEQLSDEQSKTLKPDRLLTKGGQPDAADSYRLQDHRNALTRAQRRKAEAEAQLTEAERNAARARRAVDELIQDVLNA